MNDLSALSNQASVNLSATNLIAGLLLVGLMCQILALIFVRHSSSISNKKTFANNFVLIGVTTMLIISVVKSSLALSLGLVGALSIIRFRTAIKEPEELAFIFLVISLGLGIGASQYKVTTVAFVLICAYLVIRSKLRQKNRETNMYITINSAAKDKLNLTSLNPLLDKQFDSVSLKRAEETKNNIELSLKVSFKDLKALNDFTQEIKTLDKDASIAYIDQAGIVV